MNLVPTLLRFYTYDRRLTPSHSFPHCPAFTAPYEDLTAHVSYGRPDCVLHENEIRVSTVIQSLPRNQGTN